MTFLEKLKEDKPNEVRGGINGQRGEDCPEDYGYEGKFDCTGLNCYECWNREMPDTEQKEDEDKEWLDGYEKGKIDGLNDAWELLSKLYDFTCDEILEIFGLKNGFYDVIRNYTPQEALAKLKAYEEAQIEVGDVVKLKVAEKICVISKVKENGYLVIFKDGSGGTRTFSRYDFEKTGKHIDISSILEQIGE